MKLYCLILLGLCTGAHASIGSFTELQGTTAELKRGNTSLKVQSQTSVNSNDTVIVGSKTTAGITFQDKSKVKITENSRLVIDDFVYDPKKSDASKIGMKVALGTVRMASGQIAKNNAQNVNIKTPTATVAVRGTDFAMTVDEAGRSIVALLPSCDDEKKLNNFMILGNCTVGQIDVITDAGTVTLNTAYTATYVTDANQPPLPPVAIDPAAVGNDSNLKKPSEIARVESERDDKKDQERDKSKFSDDERKKASEGNEKLLADKNKRDGEETKLIGLNAGNNGDLGNATSNPCWPFNDCGNEKGLNWYHRLDDDRGNTILIRSGETMDNTTYNISINSNDIDTKIVGDGSNKVTVRIWNK